MNTVVIRQAEVRVPLEQLLEALRQLSPADREIVRREINRDAWRVRFREALDDIRTRAAQHPLTDAEIDAEVEAVRAERYARKHQSGR